LATRSLKNTSKGHLSPKPSDKNKKKKHVYASNSQHITLQWGIKTYEDLVTAYGSMPITSSGMHEIRTAGSELNKFFP
jgi:hypothetical protein